MKYFVPDSKSSNICDLICTVLNAKKVHIKVLAKLCGKFQFCYRAFGPSEIINTFFLLFDIKSQFMEFNDLFV